MEFNNSTIPINISTDNWVRRISNIFSKELALEIDHLPPACVFEVTKTLKTQKPEAYTPQLIGLGVYHHLHPDLYHMERYKLAAISQLSTNPDQIFHFQQLVINHLKEIDPFTRACYNKFLDYDQDTIAWIIGIDGCFLLHLLSSYSGTCDSNSNSKHTTTLLGNTMVTRDIMMVENQIPFLHLKEIRRCLNLCYDNNNNNNNNSNSNNHHHPESDHNQDHELLTMFLNFCQLISPLKLTFEKDQINYEPLHLLDLLYNLIVYIPNPNSPKSRSLDIVVKSPSSSASSSYSAAAYSNSMTSTCSDSHRRKESEEIQNKLESIIGFVDTLGNERGQKILKPIKAVSTIPWSSISGMFRNGTVDINHGEENTTDREIEIPSVLDLYRFAGIKCRPLMPGGGMNDIEFVEEELTLYLPILCLNSTSEVILKNIVAFEAAMSKPNLEFARYINLMNGIIDTEKDVKLLKENGVIIEGSLKDDEIADMFNGMKRFYVKHYKKSHIEIAIDKVNGYYKKKRSVRFLRQMKRNMYASWKGMAIISTVVMFLVLGLQAFCQVYGCSKLWGGKFGDLSD